MRHGGIYGMLGAATPKSMAIRCGRCRTSSPTKSATLASPTLRRGLDDLRELDMVRDIGLDEQPPAGNLPPR